MDKEEYQKAIPKCCRHKTAEEHLDVMMLCWGITAGFVQEKGESYCKDCSENVNCSTKEISNRV